jgi:hypothetical protein
MLIEQIMISMAVVSYSLMLLLIGYYWRGRKVVESPPSCYEELIDRSAKRREDYLARIANLGYPTRHKESP